MASIETACYEIYNENILDLYDESNSVRAATVLSDNLGSAKSRKGLPTRRQACLLLVESQHISTLSCHFTPFMHRRSC